MGARLIELEGRINEGTYFAIAIHYPAGKYSQEIILQAPESLYPDGNERKFFQDLVDKLNSEVCPHHYFNGGDCAP